MATFITTVDNPYNPFTEFESWYSFDQRQGYNTLSLLDRVARTSGDLSEKDQALALDQAINEIVRENVSGMHKLFDDNDNL